MAFSKSEMLRYGVCGVLATALDYGLLALMHWTWGWYYLSAASLAFISAVVFNYLLSITWVFRGYERKELIKEFAYFAGINFCSLGLSLLIVGLAGEANLLLSKPVATVVSASFNYGAKKLILFKKPLQ